MIIILLIYFYNYGTCTVTFSRERVRFYEKEVPVTGIDDVRVVLARLRINLQ